LRSYSDLSRRRQQHRRLNHRRGWLRRQPNEEAMPTKMKRTIELNEGNFEREVLKSSYPVLVEFVTAWSLPSTMLNGALEEIAAEFVDLKVARVQLDRSPNLGLWYGIRCFPTVLYFIDGEARIGIFGRTSKEAILSQLKPVVNSRRGGSFAPLGKD